MLDWDQNALDRSGRALKAMAAKRRRDVAAKTAKIESPNFDGPLIELLDEIGFAKRSPTTGGHV